MSKLSNILLSILLIFMVTVSPVLGGIVEDENHETTVIHEGADDKVTDEKESGSSSDKDTDVMDKIYSDDKFLGFDRNKDYDFTEDLSLQNGFDLASSLPPWTILIICILLLVIGVLTMIGLVVLWNMIKGGKAAARDNPTEAAKGIRDAKMITREYIYQVVEGFGAIGLIMFLVMLFM